MPVLAGGSEVLMQCYSELKDLSSALTPTFNLLSSVKKTAGQFDLLKEYAGYLVYVEEGAFKLCFDGKVVRMVEDGDLFYLSADLSRDGAVLFCEYAGKVRILKHSIFQGTIAGDKELEDIWRKWEVKQADMLIHLSNHYLLTSLRPNIHALNFDAGEVVIQEGDESSEVFELLDGRASVYVHGKKVAEIEEGAVFGEIQFLIGSKRSATIKTDTICTINSIHRDDFAEMVKTRPQLILNIAKNLAEKLVELQNKS
ncbi:MAG: hypothetical protein COA79_23625 [Planctomycetota bacterium]|nr:MAG: hypothetical protein COA79_23625 [Planctomycetota bacterium]